jgi:hypothetical protein
MHAAKSMVTPGATPFGTAFRRPKFFGVTPGVSHSCMRMFGRVHTNMQAI